LFYNKRASWLQKILLGSKKYLEIFLKYVTLSFFVHLSKILMTYDGKVTQLKTSFSYNLMIRFLYRNLGLQGRVGFFFEMSERIFRRNVFLKNVVL
jgi:hypothetical protein